jgi:hypothetical protein
MNNMNPMMLPLVILGAYSLGCVFALIFFMLARLPASIERRSQWPVIFLWPLVVCWPFHALVQRLIRRRGGRR